MNPYNRFKKWIIGDALASTEDVFEKVKVDVLFSFTMFFFITNLPYLYFTYFISSFQFLVASLSVIGLLFVLIIFRVSKNVRAATLFYVSVHCLLNILHFIMNNGIIEAQGILFFLLITLFSYLMLGKNWGLFFTGFITLMVLIGIYNETHNMALFSVPEKYHEPTSGDGVLYLIIIPLLLNIYLVSQFVKARLKAEKIIDDQKNQLELNNKNLESKNEDILSSIQYAKRIQQAVLPPEEKIQREIPLSFVLYKPKDIVSGDFFWFHSINANQYILAVADCTGHRVPGAFMTVIGSNLLNQIVIDNKIEKPSEILNELDLHLTATLRQEKQHRGLVQDGMDISIISVNKLKKEICFSSAKRPAYFIHEAKLNELKGSKLSIGGLREEVKHFTESVFNYSEDDCIYLFSDGMVDQFGGPQNKKLTSKRLRESLLSISELSMHEQLKQMEDIFENWRGNNEQTDDAVMIGIRF